MLNCAFVFLLVVYVRGLIYRLFFGRFFDINARSDVFDVFI